MDSLWQACSIKTVIRHLLELYWRGLLDFSPAKEQKMEQLEFGITSTLTKCQLEPVLEERFAIYIMQILQGKNVARELKVCMRRSLTRLRYINVHMLYKKTSSCSKPEQFSSINSIEQSVLSVVGPILPLVNAQHTGVTNKYGYLCMHTCETFYSHITTNSGSAESARLVYLCTSSLYSICTSATLDHLW